MTGYDVSVRTVPGGADTRAIDLPLVTVRHEASGSVELDLGTLTGAHVLHLAVAMCVFNDLFREARLRGLRLFRVAVTAGGDFTAEPGPFRSTGVTYSVDVDGDAPDEELRALVEHVERIAEIPHALRQGMSVRMADARFTRSQPLVQ